MNVETQGALRQASSSLINQASKNTSADGRLGKNEFLNLFMTQMSNQDPMNPMESKEMMGQLAQMGIMEQIQNMNTQMEVLNETQKGMAKYQASQFLGKDIVVEGKGIDLYKGGASPVFYQLDNDANEVSIQIKNSDGETILNRSLGLTTAGHHEYSWDGKNSQGVVQPQGKYEVKIKSKDSNEKVREIDTFQNIKVSQVEYKKGKPWLIGGKKRVSADEILAVNKKSQELFGKANPLPIRGELSPKPLINGQGRPKLK